MSINPTAPLAVEAAPTNSSPIENEIPTYRAISNRAILSLICGALAAISVAELWFLVFAALAVVLGVTANLAIKRRPDLLTGRGLANTGVALGLVIGLGVSTYTIVQGIIIKREASKFAVVYADVLKKGSFGDALLYRIDPANRKDKTAAEMEQEFQAQKARERGLAEQKMASLMNIRKALQVKGTDLHFISIETQGLDEERVDRVGVFAAALYELDGYDPKVHLEGGEHALALPEGRRQGAAL